MARGKSRCDNINNIIKNAQEIANNGIKEIVITGVNIGDFKQDNLRFIDLIKKLDQVDGIERYRISSIEPNLITDEIIDFVKKSNKFMPHFHIPLQSGSDKILGEMKRRYTTKLYTKKVNKIKKEIPNVCIGADVIVGFPGESDKDFNETLDFIKNLPISYLHVFSYSERDNTKAILLKESVEKQKRAERSKSLRILSSKLQRTFYQEYKNTFQTALFEQENKDGYIHGFTDNYIKIKAPYNPNLKKTKQEVFLSEIDDNLIMNAQIESLCIQQ